ncbi:MAG TPA: methylated-DNA--[protein]-cysteine S-methyltransferase [Steroidobacteraceae bacterium]|nr:methylated-DNA--[protein]-cysteine S-methyltransferase [Steroidobacteraceae bacterium]
MNTHIHFDIGSSTLGRVLVASNDRGVCAIFMADTDNELIAQLRERFPEAELTPDTRRLARALPRVIEFIESPTGELDFPLDPTGTEFQRRVWQALRRIPAGATASYADIARRIDAPKSFRAVAQACGANPIALAIPCHRVVRNDGAISGYRWGVTRKRALLDREAAR